MIPGYIHVWDAREESGKSDVNEPAQLGIRCSAAVSPDGPAAGHSRRGNGPAFGDVPRAGENWLTLNPSNTPTGYGHHCLQSRR